MTRAKTANCRHQHVIALRNGTSLGTATLALLLLPGLVLGSTASAQTILPPAPPPGGPVSGPPDGAIPPGPPIRLPTPAPAPAPTPAPAPPRSPPASPTPAPTPAPTPPRERPQPERQERPEPADQPTPPDQAPTETPGEAAPAPVDDAPAPAAEPMVEPLAPAPPPEPAKNSVLPFWWPLALAAALAALLVGGWWARGRRRQSTQQEQAHRAASASPSVPRPATKPPSAAKPKALQPNAPAVRIEPLTASTTLVNLRLRYALIIENPSDGDIALTDYADTILAGSGAQEDVIRSWFTAAPHAPLSMAIAATGTLRIERELAIPLGQLRAMKVRDKAVLIPVLLLSLAYRQGTGPGQIGCAFVIGKPGQGDGKLGPLPLDQGMGGFGPLAARDTGISQTIATASAPALARTPAMP